jgi:hypothetical protein
MPLFVFSVQKSARKLHRIYLFASRDTAIAFGMADAEGQNVRIRLDNATQQC